MFEIDLTDRVPGAREAGIRFGLDPEMYAENPREDMDFATVLWTIEDNYVSYDDRDQKGAYIDLTRPSDDAYYGFMPGDDWPETLRRLRQAGCEGFCVRRTNGGELRVEESGYGACGVLYVTREIIKREWGKPGAKIATAEARAKARNYLRHDLDPYNCYATNEVYGYIINVVDYETGDVDVEDAVWGFYGRENAEEAAIEAVEALMARYRQEAA